MIQSPDKGIARIRSAARPRLASQLPPRNHRKFSQSRISLDSGYSLEDEEEPSCKSDPRLYYKPKKPHKEILLHSERESRPLLHDRSFNQDLYKLKPAASMKLFIR